MRKTVATSICFIALGACAPSVSLTPVTDPTERLTFSGFSVQPPVGSDWHRMHIQPPPGFLTVVVFHKMSPDLLAEQRKGHTFAATVKFGHTGGMTFDTAEELGEFSDKTFRDNHKNDSRFTLVESSYEVDRSMGEKCVSMHQVQEDRGAPGLVGTVLLIDAYLIRCIHPQSERHVVDVGYHERRRTDLRPWSLEAEVEPFMQSFRFEPIH